MTTTALSFSWQIQYSDDDGVTWLPVDEPDAAGIVTQDPAVPERRDIFQVACTQADLYAAEHGLGMSGRRWQAVVQDSDGKQLGVEANLG